eukprot:TRINITY_DN528_c0_g1_i5.p1 TRINITY_DN528_c0_g1~~TRINITY_DN528_c0_g1_i5.p1  ORF type:complete len:88 (+),score=6.35 TRINITY_DN528_c0_g1_i5:104-367(+)
MMSHSAPSSPMSGVGGNSSRFSKSRSVASDYFSSIQSLKNERGGERTSRGKNFSVSIYFVCEMGIIFGVLQNLPSIFRDFSHPNIVI